MSGPARGCGPNDERFRYLMDLMAALRRPQCRKPSCRPLRVEPLEERWLLDGSPLDPSETPLPGPDSTTAGWFGGVVHDGSGDLFAVDLDGGMAIEHLGTMDPVMFDVAFSPSGELFGVGGSLWGPSQLYSIDVDFDSPSPVIQTQLLGTLHVADEHPIYVNALDFRPDGTLFAAGYDLFGGRYVYSIDTSTAEANEEVSIGGHGSAGDLTFDVDGNMLLTTSAGELVRVDPGLSRIDVVGPVGSVDFYGLAYGPGPVMHGFRQGGKFTASIRPTPGRPRSRCSVIRNSTWCTVRPRCTVRRSIWGRSISWSCPPRSPCWASSGTVWRRPTMPI